jgi:hypothetical protein
MKLRLRLAAIASAILLTAGLGVALAGPASAFSPGPETNWYSNVAGYGDLWWNPNASASIEPNGAFESSHSNKTPLESIGCVSTGCEMQLPNGLCMTYNYDAGGLLDAIACNELQSQIWTETVAPGEESVVITNYYASHTLFGCDDYIGSAGSGQEVSLGCNSVGTYDEWALIPDNPDN